MKLTYYGHACFAVQTAGRVLVFDPFITPNELARGIDLEKVPADYIFVSHGHFDHIADAVALAKHTGATVVSNHEICNWLLRQGVAKTHALNHGGSARLDFGRAMFTAAVHSSSLPDGTYGGNPGGFLVQTAEGDFYYAGDTALTQDMKLIGETARLRFAALPIGDTFTMGVDDAVRAAEFLRCTEVFGLHYNTFAAIRIDEAEAVAKFRAARKHLRLLLPGESHNF